MVERINISSGAVWEDIVGYSRAVRVGNVVEVAGTTAVDEEGRVVGPDDLYAQTSYILAKIEQALSQAGATMSDVVRTRIYLTDISWWPEMARAHAESFAAVKPATTAVQVAALINPEMLVEIEVTAIVGDKTRKPQP
ncbi:MAG: RidA family protein [Caldilineales bacterium]|nr:RidA family protein [Caldilineales bacterium]